MTGSTRRTTRAAELGRVGERRGLRLPDPEPAVRGVPPQGRDEASAAAWRSATRSSTSAPRTRPARSPAKRRPRRRTAPAPRSTRSWRWGRGTGRRCAGALARAARGLAARAASSRAASCRRRRPSTRCRLEIGDYTDFYASIHHATNVGKLFRPDNPLLPNYKWVPIGYHGRGSSIVVSGQAFPRPHGQTKPPGAAEPVFGPSKRLDYELELGLLHRPRQRARRRRSRSPSAETHVFGLVPAERLVGARHPGLGIPAARAVPRQELRDHDLAVDRHARGARAVRVAVDARRPAIRSRCPTSTRPTTRARGGSTSRSRPG